MNNQKVAQDLVASISAVEVKDSRDVKVLVELTEDAINNSWRSGFHAGILCGGFVAITAALWTAIYLHGWV
jgi:hypothetical protein